MPEYVKTTITPWADEYVQPEPDALLEAIGSPDREACAHAIEFFRARKGCREKIEWLGQPWRWTLTIHQTGIDHPALAYLILSPVTPLICIPVPIVGPAAPDISTLTKPVRTLLDRAPVIAGYFWPEWPIADLDPVAIRPLLDARDRAVSQSST